MGKDVQFDDSGHLINTQYCTAFMCIHHSVTKSRTSITLLSSCGGVC